MYLERSVVLIDNNIINMVLLLQIVHMQQWHTLLPKRKDSTALFSDENLF